MSPQDVSVVIPALNEADHIETAIESVWNNGVGQTIVCDGGSDDATVSLARQQGADVVDSPPGRGVQLATGAATAQGQVLLFLHADNFLGEHCITELCARVGETATAKDFWGGFKQQIAGDSRLYRALEWGNAARIRFRGMPFGDQAMFVNRSMYDRVGGFRPIPLMEDVALSKLLRKECWPLLIDRFVHVDSRRWRKRGVVRQTIRNWGIQFAHGLGVTENRLSKWYR